jgi:hypothetical protein
MNFVKIVALINWVVIAVLAVLVAGETLSPAKGGDAAGRGIGQAIYYLAMIALAVLLVLNLLPYKWSKYAALILIVAPFVLFKANSVWKNARAYLNRDTTPLFADPQREAIADAIYEAQPEKLRKLLQTPVPLLNEPGKDFTLLELAVDMTSRSESAREERLQCVELLIGAGASIEGPDQPVYVRNVGLLSPDVLRLLLRHGADPNALANNYSTGTRNMPILFDLIQSTYGSDQLVRILLEHGADPNAVRPDDTLDRPGYSALLYAAALEEWGIARLLLQRGADPGFRAPDGETLERLVKAAGAGPGGAKAEDFEAVKKEFM